MVNFELLKSALRYLSEIFTISISHVCANLMKKFLPLLNQPARNGPFLPKFWTALATVIVGIFFRKNFWWGFRPISVAYLKEFWISWKQRRFQIFQKPSSLGFQSFLAKLWREKLQTCASAMFHFRASESKTQWIFRTCKVQETSWTQAQSCTSQKVGFLKWRINIPYIFDHGQCSLVDFKYKR